VRNAQQNDVSLPTFVPRTRGYTPWRPAADIGTGRTRRFVEHSSLFTVRPRAHQMPRITRDILPAIPPYLRSTRFQGGRWMWLRRNPRSGKTNCFPRLPITWPLNRKDNSPWDPWRSHEACINVTVCIFRRYPGAGILTRFPFGAGGLQRRPRYLAETKLDLRLRSLRFEWSFPDSLGPTHLRPIAISAKPFSTTVLKVLT